MSHDVVIVGGGLAGLVAARRLHQAGLEVLLVEKDHQLGGRMQTDEVEGFLLDRGFHVFYESYPHAMLELNLRALDLREFEPGAKVWDGKRMRALHKGDILSTVFERFWSVTDLMRLNTWNATVREMSISDIWQMEDQPVEEFLLGQKLSREFIERFVRPFFGGIFLDRGLQESCRPFAFYWKMMEEGRTVIPAKGIGEIPRQIASDIPVERVRTGVTVASLLKSGNKVTGIKLSSGEEILAESVIIATDGATATQLTGVPTISGYKACTTIHYAAPTKPTADNLLILNGPGLGQINHVMCVSGVSRDLAPLPEHLVSVTLLGNHEEEDLYLAKSVRYEMSTWLPKAKVSAWRPLRVDRIPQAQMPQPVGFASQMAPIKTATEGLFLAGEYTTYLGSDGAIKSGQQAAIAVLEHLRQPALA
ncbi:MAG: FAD-dependent oxidoreductase [Fimbriimonadaceae bacterium]|jgi:phytoene dehydrogenase-like protein|nr:FAD-dependent oxidoreductase [Fimbriimonadaceae bacterium]